MYIRIQKMGYMYIYVHTYVYTYTENGLSYRNIDIMPLLTFQKIIGLYVYTYVPRVDQ